jgi:hypothetical protein
LTDRKLEVFWPQAAVSAERAGGEDACGKTFDLRCGSCGGIPA